VPFCSYNNIHRNGKIPNHTHRINAQTSPND
jgi:hypothetical protein